MKRILFIFSTFLFLFSCGNNADSKKTAGETSGTTEISATDKAKGMELIAKSDCLTCHKVTEASIGPPYASIAAKYKILDKPAMDSMVKQIIEGGAGRWGAIQMTPHPDLTKEDAQLMVRYIMSLKK